jgi:hypothetical protein
MSFAVYALLAEDGPPLTTEILASNLGKYFNEEEVTIAIESLPFSSQKTIVLRWPGWLIRLAYEEGMNILNESKEIRRILAQQNEDIIESSRRINAVFGSDDSHTYTNQTIIMLEYLRDIPGTAIFNPQSNSLMTA